MVESAAPEPSIRPRRPSWLSWHGLQKDPAKDISRTTLLFNTGLTSPAEGHEQTFPSDSGLDSGVCVKRRESSSKTSRPNTPIRGSLSPSFKLLSLNSSPHSSVAHLQQDDQVPLSDGSTPPLSVTSPPSATTKSSESRNTGSFGKLSFSSMIGGLSSLSLTRSNTDDKDKDKESRGRSSMKRKHRSSSFTLPSHTKEKDKDKDTASIASKESIRARSSSPFNLRRFRPRSREASPTPLPLEESDSESITSRRTPSIRPRNAFTDDPDSGSEYAGEETEDEEDEWSDGTTTGMFDFVTERNTEQNALIAAHEMATGEMDPDDAGMDPDPLGEGVNVIVPPEPYFPSTLNRTSYTSMKGKRGSSKRKKSRHHETLPLQTSRPIFQRDRCTITLTQGNPEASERRRRMYIVASDLSEESRYAVEWGIGTVIRDGDHL